MRGIDTTDGNVISMSGFRGEPGFRSLHEVEAYWEGLRQGRVVPQRSDIDPRGIENALEYAFILETIAPGLARIRIAGTHLSDIMGMEVRGMPISSFLPPAARIDMVKLLDAVTNRPSVARLSLKADTGIGKPPLEGRMLLLPLRSDFGDVSRILGCFETRGQIGRAPRRFELTGQVLRPLDSGDTSSSAGPRNIADAQPKAPLRSHGFGEPGTAFHSGSKPQKRPGYLRLIKSDD